MGTDAPATTSPATTDVVATAASTTVGTTQPETTVASTTVAPSTVAPTTIPSVTFTGSCTSSEGTWTVGIASGWYAAGPEAGLWSCAAFDRSPVVIPDESDVSLPIVITAIDIDSASVLAAYNDSTAVEVLTQADVTVDGRQAWRIETRATGAGPVEQGTLGITYIVSLGSQRAVEIDGQGATNAEYADVQVVVDAMAANITFPA